MQSEEPINLESWKRRRQRTFESFCVLCQRSSFHTGRQRNKENQKNQRIWLLDDWIGTICFEYKFLACCHLHSKECSHLRYCILLWVCVTSWCVLVCWASVHTFTSDQTCSIFTSSVWRRCETICEFVGLYRCYSQCSTYSGWSAISLCCCFGGYWMWNVPATLS